MPTHRYEHIGHDPEPWNTTQVVDGDCDMCKCVQHAFWHPSGHLPQHVRRAIRDDVVAAVDPDGDSAPRPQELGELVECILRAGRVIQDAHTEYVVESR